MSIPSITPEKEFHFKSWEEVDDAIVDQTSLGTELKTIVSPIQDVVNEEMGYPDPVTKRIGLALKYPKGNTSILTGLITNEALGHKNHKLFVKSVKLASYHVPDNYVTPLIVNVETFEGAYISKHDQETKSGTFVTLGHECQTVTNEDDYESLLEGFHAFLQLTKPVGESLDTVLAKANNSEYILKTNTDLFKLLVIAVARLGLDVSQDLKDKILTQDQKVVEFNVAEVDELKKALVFMEKKHKLVSSLKVDVFSSYEKSLTIGMQPPQVPIYLDFIVTFVPHKSG
jgi:hypothetical protein